MTYGFGIDAHDHARPMVLTQDRHPTGTFSVIRDPDQEEIVWETPEDLETLDRVLAASIERAGAFLRESFRMPEKSLSAEELTERLQGFLTVALATATASGEPRVAPTGAVFDRGRFCLPTVASSARVGHLRRNPAVSLTAFQGSTFAVIVHGEATILGTDHPDYQGLEERFRQTSGIDISTWGDEPVFVRVDPDRIFTYDAEKLSAYAGARHRFVGIPMSSATPPRSRSRPALKRPDAWSRRLSGCRP